MRHYLLRYFLDTTIELGQELGFHMPNNVKVVLRDRTLRDEDGFPIQYGFTIDAHCQADNPEKAIEVAGPMVEGVVSVISFSLSAAANTCVLERIIDSTPEAPERELVQYIPLAQSRIRPSRKLRLKALDTLWEHLDKLSPEYKPRVLRAIRWYRKSLLEEDVLDQFVNLWTGLEVINHLVKKKHGLPEKGIRKCPNCGKDVDVPQTSAGIKYLVPEESWSDASETRKALLHGFGDLQNLLGKVGLLNPVLRSALLKGILDLMEIPGEKQTQLIREPLRNVRRPSIKACASIHNLVLKDVISGKLDPRLEIVSSDIDAWLDEEGKKQERGVIRVKLLGHEGTWSPRVIEVIAEKDPEDASAQLVVKTD